MATSLIPPGMNSHVAAVGPAQLLQPMQERRDAGPSFRIVRGQVHKHTDAPHPARAAARVPRAAKQTRRRAGPTTSRYRLHRRACQSHGNVNFFAPGSRDVGKNTRHLQSFEACCCRSRRCKVDKGSDPLAADLAETGSYQMSVPASNRPDTRHHPLRVKGGRQAVAPRFRLLPFAGGTGQSPGAALAS
jgi:hypothetical protein